MDDTMTPEEEIAIKRLFFQGAGALMAEMGSVASNTERMAWLNTVVPEYKAFIEATGGFLEKPNDHT